MAAEYGYVNEQTIALNSSAILNDFAPCQSGLILHESESPILLLKGIVLDPCYDYECCCCRSEYVQYRVTANGNISIPEGGTVAAVAVALTLGGIVIPASEAILTLAAVGEFNPFSIDKIVNVPIGSSSPLSLTNILPGVETTETGQAIVMRNLNIIVDRVND